MYPSIYLFHYLSGVHLILYLSIFLYINLSMNQGRAKRGRQL